MRCIGFLWPYKILGFKKVQDNQGFSRFSNKFWIYWIKVVSHGGVLCVLDGRIPPPFASLWGGGPFACRLIPLGLRPFNNFLGGSIYALTGKSRSGRFLFKNFEMFFIILYIFVKIPTHRTTRFCCYKMRGGRGLGFYKNSFRRKDRPAERRDFVVTKCEESEDWVF